MTGQGIVLSYNKIIIILKEWQKKTKHIMEIGRSVNWKLQLKEIAKFQIGKTHNSLLTKTTAVMFLRKLIFSGN